MKIRSKESQITRNASITATVVQSGNTCCFFMTTKKIPGHFRDLRNSRTFLDCPRQLEPRTIIRHS